MHGLPAKLPKETGSTHVEGCSCRIRARQRSEGKERGMGSGFYIIKMKNRKQFTVVCARASIFTSLTLIFISFFILIARNDQCLPVEFWPQDPSESWWSFWNRATSNPFPIISISLPELISSAHCRERENEKKGTLSLTRQTRFLLQRGKCWRKKVCKKREIKRGEVVAGKGFRTEWQTMGEWDRNLRVVGSRYQEMQR